MTFSTVGIGGFASLHIFFGMAKEASRGTFFKFLIMTLLAAVVGCILQPGDIFVGPSWVARSAALRLRLFIGAVMTIDAIPGGFRMSFMIKGDHSKFHMMTLQACSLVLEIFGMILYIVFIKSSRMTELAGNRI